jgi:heat shock protein HtpX
VFNVGAAREAWRSDRTGRSNVTGLAPRISFALVPFAPHMEMLRVTRSGVPLVVEMHLPSSEAGVVLRCRIEPHPQEREPSRFRRPAGQTENSELPELFNILAEVCSRAGLFRLPELYCVAAPGDMNAYALGGPGRAAIVLTEGLLRGMTRDEIAGILAHEVAHICNNDAWTMSWAAALHRAIEWTSLTGLALLRARHGGIADNRPSAALLNAAPMLGRLLGLALSRTRELDADATALELTGDSRALIAALDKLERHHVGLPVLCLTAREDDPMRLLRSHPATSERVGALLSLVH